MGKRVRIHVSFRHLSKKWSEHSDRGVLVFSTSFRGASLFQASLLTLRREACKKLSGSMGPPEKATRGKKPNYNAPLQAAGHQFRRF